jgi:hypothetical protein
MHRRAYYHPPTQRIYTPSGFAIEMPRQAAVDRQLTHVERLLYAQARRNAWGRSLDELVENAHPLLEAFVRQKLAEMRRGDVGDALKQQYRREREERAVGLRGTCVSRLDPRSRAQVGRNEQNDAAWEMTRPGTAYSKLACQCVEGAKKGVYDPVCDVCLDRVLDQRRGWTRDAMLQPVPACVKRLDRSRGQGVPRRLVTEVYGGFLGRSA